MLRQGHRHRPEPDRAHAEVEPGDVHRPLHARPRAVLAHPGGEGRGYKPGRFSFNVRGGRCEACKGDGTIKIEMHFLLDVYVPCETCHGRRYNRETLEVRFKGVDRRRARDVRRGGARVLREDPEDPAATADAARRRARLHQARPAATTLRGEAQRVKLAAELSKVATGKTLYILDEPTTGLHFADIEKLLEVPAPRRQREHGARDRAQPRRRQAGGLDRRPRARGRRRGRRGDRSGHAGGHRRREARTPGSSCAPCSPSPRRQPPDLPPSS